MKSNGWGTMSVSDDMSTHLEESAMMLCSSKVAALPMRASLYVDEDKEITWLSKSHNRPQGTSLYTTRDSSAKMKWCDPTNHTTTKVSIYADDEEKVVWSDESHTKAGTNEDDLETILETCVNRRFQQGIRPDVNRWARSSTTLLKLTKTMIGWLHCRQPHKTMM